MAGKLIADQIEHSTAGSLDTSYVVNGSVKAWCSINMDSASIRDSFSTSSIVDNQVGGFSINFTNIWSYNVLLS